MCPAVFRALVCCCARSAVRGICCVRVCLCVCVWRPSRLSECIFGLWKFRYQPPYTTPSTPSAAPPPHQQQQSVVSSVFVGLCMCLCVWIANTFSAVCARKWALSITSVRACLYIVLSICDYTKKNKLTNKHLLTVETQRRRKKVKEKQQRVN